MKARKPLVTWPEVVGSLGSDQTRGAVIRRFRDRMKDAAAVGPNFSLTRQSREAMLEALIATEDELEAKGSRRLSAERVAMLGVRRKLEVELWP